MCKCNATQRDEALDRDVEMARQEGLAQHEPHMSLEEMNKLEAEGRQKMGVSGEQLPGGESIEGSSGQLPGGASIEVTSMDVCRVERAASRLR